MTRGWLVVMLVGTLTVLIKAAGPVVLARRTLPPSLQPVLKLLPPALFASLTVTQVLVHGNALTVDARIGGLVVAVVGACGRVSPPIVLLGSAAVTAGIRRFLE
jgi:branched-subunit amino acid transport protein